MSNVIQLTPEGYCACRRWQKPVGGRIGFRLNSGTNRPVAWIELYTTYRCPECGREHRDDVRVRDGACAGSPQTSNTHEGQEPK